MIILILVALDRTHCERQLASDTAYQSDVSTRAVVVSFDIGVERSEHEPSPSMLEMGAVSQVRRVKDDFERQETEKSVEHGLILSDD